jgi:hypothetical protein
MKRWGALCVVAVAVLASAAFAATASASSAIRVTLVVHETFAGGTVLRTTVPGCAAGDRVETLDPQRRLLGQNWMFTGFKRVDCRAAGTFTFAYQAVARVACSPNDVGTWKIVGGTGSFANVTGGGRLIGTYTPAGACPPLGIDDAWTGVMIFR